ncbi:MAG: hypothetical protein ACI9J3_002221 [Parvicellaceae bacterium]|jgi:hypothetical protein
MALEYKLPNILKGGIIYAAGDTIAALIINDFSVVRLIGIFVIGATLYAIEIPNYFKWIDRKMKPTGSFGNSIKRASMAMLYFNPLWIARHILIIELLLGNYDTISWAILLIGLTSFIVNIPVSLIANYLIQNKFGLKHRFLASAIFSGLMAIYYSLSKTWFA